ncbi:MAG: hypothetical protein CBD97_02960 [Pelagibacteraceae bacterium TMED237]|nr:MAG: hypothetical protein CBD97_02960 [Pelagibacteraceae bacterium TMED237]|tara:strand:- start:882 stop:2168 length:1287 start_codon:yes stop_codon:yes gene_type:complete
MKIYLIIIIIFIFKNTFALSINDSVKSTIENNLKVQIAFENLKESRENIEASVGKKLPTVTGTISGTYSNNDTTSASGINTTPETFTDKYKIIITQNLYDAGEKNFEIEKEKITYENAVLNFYKTVQDLSLTAIEGYLTVINYEKSQEASKKNYDSVSRFLEEIKLKYELGSSTITDLKNAESAFAIAETNLFASDQNYKVSLKTFKSIVGKEAIDLNDYVNIKNDLNFNNILSNVYKNNFNILIAKNNIKIKEIDLSKEKSSNKPSLDITASTEYSDGSRIDNGSENTNASIGLTLTIPIFQQNIDKSDIRKINSQILQNEIQYEDLRDTLNIEVSNYFKNYLISQSNLKTSLLTIDYANTLLQSTQEEYNLGTKSITDLIEAETNLLNVKVDYFDANKNYLINYFNLLALDGSLIKLFEDYLPNYN